MKKILFICFFCLIFSGFTANAAEETSYEEYYSVQLRESGAEDLPEELPEETRDALENLGIVGMDWESISELSPDKLFNFFGETLADVCKEPFGSILSVLAVLLLFSLLNGIQLSSSVYTTFSFSATLCVAVAIVHPVVSFMEYSANVAESAAGFLLACVPVLAGIMLAAGQVTGASSFQIITTAAGNGILWICSGIVLPLMNLFLGMSVVSSVSSEVHLKGFCDIVSKIIKWILNFCMTVFTGLLAVHSVVTAAVDSAAGRTIRFMLSSSVPVVGGALGEAFNTVAACVKTLRSGVTAFAVLAECILFFPAILQCILWRISLMLCISFSRMFSLSEATALLEAVEKVIEIVQAVLLCSMTVLTITGTIMVIMGGGG